MIEPDTRERYDLLKTQIKQADQNLAKARLAQEGETECKYAYTDDGISKLNDWLIEAQIKMGEKVHKIKVARGNPWRDAWGRFASMWL